MTKTSNEATFSERIRQVRRTLGLTQEEFASLAGFTRSYLSQLESGVKSPGPKFVKKLLDFERNPRVGAIAGDPSPSPGRVQNEDDVESVRMIPLISYAQAGIAVNFESIPEDWQEKLPSVVKDRDAFAVTIRGDSMEPKYQEGDVAVLLPNSAARNGDLVVANIKEDGFALKVLNLVGGDPRRIKLTSYNADVYPPNEYDREQFHWIYPVHSVTKLIRR